MTITTIKLNLETKKALDKYREHKNESYNDIIRKMLYIIKNMREEPELSEEVLREVEAARKRVEAGHFYTEKEANEKFGLSIK